MLKRLLHFFGFVKPLSTAKEFDELNMRAAADLLAGRTPRDRPEFRDLYFITHAEALPNSDFPSGHSMNDAVRFIKRCEKAEKNTKNKIRKA